MTHKLNIPNIKPKKDDEGEEFLPDDEVCPQCDRILKDDEDACSCMLEEDYETYWASFLGCDVGASEEEVDQAFEDQMT